jgi:hypothetical protein
MMSNQDQSDIKDDSNGQQTVDDDGPDEPEYVGSSPVPSVTAELTDEEKQILVSLKRLGLEYSGHERSIIRFRRSPDLYPRSEGAFLRDKVSDLARQLDDELVNHPTNLGFVVPSRGYAEIVIRDNRWPRPPVSTERILQLDYDQFDCLHKEPDQKLSSLPYTSRFSAGVTLKGSRIHLVDKADSPCMELSNASSLAMLLYGSPFMGSDRIPLMLTIKLDFGSTLDEEFLIRRSDDLVRSLIYELDIRNGSVVGSAVRPLRRDARQPTLPKKKIDKIRYPQVQIKREVADLFNFAGHAYDNRPLAFLSYYQTLEYFIPIAVRQSTFRMIRRELRDPTFDRDNDSSILRIVSTAERSSRLVEIDQLRALVREYVRRDQLDEFFAADWGNYFSKRGPISGVEAINLANPSKDLGDQVADRIYQIRNRIVHAKDDPRYEDAGVMLPRSQEAEALGPDIELVRLLAMEAVLAGQG